MTRPRHSAPEPADTAARRAEALRANLARRKAQSRARAAAEAAPADPPIDDALIEDAPARGE